MAGTPLLLILADASQQLPTANLWEMVGRYGFNALLVVILLICGREELGKERKSREEQGDKDRTAREEEAERWRKELREQRRAGDRNTRMVTLALLQLANLLPGVREQLESIKREVDGVEMAEKNERES